MIDLRRELWRIVDKIELMQIPDMFSEAGKKNMLIEVIKDMKDLIKDIDIV